MTHDSGVFHINAYHSIIYSIDMYDMSEYELEYFDGMHY